MASLPFFDVSPGIINSSSAGVQGGSRKDSKHAERVEEVGGRFSPLVVESHAPSWSKIAKQDDCA